VTISTITVNLGADATICPGASLVLDAGAQAGFTYLWSTGASTPTITVTQAGTYSVTVTDASGCTGSDALNVGLVSDAAAVFNVPTTGFTTQPIAVSASGVTDVNWNFGSGANPSTASGTAANVTYTTPGTKTIAVTYTIGNCTFNRTLTIAVENSVSRTETRLAELKVYPNPSRDVVRLSARWDRSLAGEFRLVNALGQSVVIQPFAETTELNTTFSVAGLPAGLYQLVVQTGEGRWNEALVVE
jgi:hypothetical protein